MQDQWETFKSITGGENFNKFILNARSIKSTHWVCLLSPKLKDKTSFLFFKGLCMLYKFQHNLLYSLMHDCIKMDTF